MAKQGTQTVSRRVSPMRASLLRAFEKTQPPTPRAAPKRPKSGHGICPWAEASGERARLIAHIRGDREILRLTFKQIAEKRGLTVDRVRQVCSYETSPHIDPAVEAA
jgi:hypothetical protein